MSRVLVVSSTFPQFDGDPRGAFILRHWEARAAAGDDVHVLAPHTAWCDGSLRTPLEVRRFRYAPPAWSTLTGRFGILENVRERPLRGLLLPSFWLGLERALARELAALRPDRVVAHMLLPSGWVVARQCARAGIPFELYGHGTDVDLLLALPAPARRRFGARASTATSIHMPSADKARRFLGRIGIPEGLLRVEPMVHVVPGPGRSPRPVLRDPEGVRFEVLFLGRMIRQKGVDDLIRAVGCMRRGPRLHLAGDGPERRRLERLADELGVDARFHGWVQGERKVDLFRNADVVCVPSREIGPLSEGAPLVIPEALAYGLPVVATNVGGIPELCADAPGTTLVPADRPDALADALAHVWDSHRRPAAAGRRGAA